MRIDEIDQGSSLPGWSCQLQLDLVGLRVDLSEFEVRSVVFTWSHLSSRDQFILEKLFDEVEADVLGIDMHVHLDDSSSRSS